MSSAIIAIDYLVSLGDGFGSGFGTVAVGEAPDGSATGDVPGVPPPSARLVACHFSHSLTFAVRASLAALISSTRGSTLPTTTGAGGPRCQPWQRSIQCQRAREGPHCPLKRRERCSQRAQEGAHCSRQRGSGVESLVGALVYPSEAAIHPLGIRAQSSAEWAWQGNHLQTCVHYRLW